jgi:hypothetical protein
MLSMRWLQSSAAFAALIVALLFGADDVDARFDSGQGFRASAASALFLPPAAAADQPTVTTSLDHPSNGQQSGSLGGLFNRPGLLGGFAAGFLGAGVLGVLFGHGLLGGLGGVPSFLGLMFQLALVVLLGRLIWIWWTGRNLPAFAGLSPRQLADPYLRSRNELGLDAIAGLDSASGRDGSATPNVSQTSSSDDARAAEHCRET